MVFSRKIGAILICFSLILNGHVAYAGWLGIGAAVIGGVGAVLVAPAALTGAGFGAAGIAASSLGSTLMSTAAVANGGGVAAGSFVALCQSAGATGVLSYTTMAAVGSAGAAAGKAASDYLESDE